MPKMNDRTKETYVSRILSGLTYVFFDGKKYFIPMPTLIDRHLAQVHSNVKYNEAVKQGVMKQEELIDCLIREKLWSHEEEYRLEELPDRIEDVKVNYYKAYANYKSRQNAKKRLKELKKEFSALTKKKSIWHQESAESFAENCKLRYEIFSSITDADGNKLFKSGEDYLHQADDFCSRCLTTFFSTQLYEEDIREIARTDPWKNFWNTGKSVGGMFSQPSTELTQEQRSVISWSRIYDSIYDSPEAPSEEVIEDNDMLDGWLILQHRKRKAQQKSSTAENQTSVKGDEVYLFADDEKDAQRIYELNDKASRGHIRQRQKEIELAREQGKSLPVEKTTEAQLEMRRMSTEKFKNSVR